MKKFLIGSAIVLSLAVAGFAPSAQAATVAELQALIAQLQQQIAGLSGGAAAGASVTFNSDLQVGSTGSDVVNLQNWLISKGFLQAGYNTGYFGSLTKAAVMAYQASVGLPSTGYVGPLTRGRLNASAAPVVVVPPTTTPPTTTPPSTNNGEEGQLTDFDNTSSDVESDVDEGEENVNVLGVEFDAEDSDMTLERVDVDITVGSGGSSQLDDYITDVSLVLDGKTLATLDVDEGDEDDDVYSFRFSGLNGMVAEDDTARLYVAVSAVNNVDSSDADVDLTVDIPLNGIRAVDEAGISDTYADSAGDVTSETFNITEAEAGDLSLSIDSSDNLDRTVTVDDDSDTNDIEILSFTLESESSDNNIEEIEIDLATTTATSTAFSAVIKQLTLYADGKEVASESVSDNANGSATVLFDNLDIDIAEDDEVEFVVKADFDDEADTREGFAFEATVDASQIEAEDAEGDSVTVSGDVTGGVIELRTSGITVALVSSQTKVTNVVTADPATPGSADTKTFEIAFSVKALNEDVYIDKSIQLTASPSSAGAGTAWATTTDSTALSTTMGSTLISASGSTDDDTSNVFKIEKNATRTFVLKVTLTALADGYTGIRLTGVNWTTDSADTTPNNTYTFDLDDIKIDPVFMNII
jgi:peptidoglycan hydrolase-like protein with peptidoglycan-binding domain